MTRLGYLLLAGCATPIAVTLAATPAAAQEATYDFNIPAQPLSSAIIQFSRQTGIAITAPRELVSGRRSSAVRGRMSSPAALTALLRGTNLRFDIGSTGGITIFGQDAPGSGEGMAAGAAADEESAIIEVVGSRIRGGALTSPVVSLTRNDMRLSGQRDLGEAFRALPQNFAGGQNPGVAQGATGGGVANQNISGSSSINLRGLGPDATLTLLNGNRLPYDGFVQATDVAVVPVSAIERVEILLDGASAIYGSDAVAGVANIVLRRDYDGAEISARYGGSTSGGNEVAQLTALGGQTWDSGGFLATFDVSRNSAIRARDRDYLAYLPNQNVTIYPEADQRSALITFHQAVGPFELALDGFYLDRDQQTLNQSTVITDASTDSEIYGLAPSIRLNLPHDWTMRLHGFLGQNDLRQVQRNFTIATGALAFETDTGYFNRARAVGTEAEGPLLELPAGAVRASLGGGYRRNTFQNVNLLTQAVTVSGARRSHYAFGELYVPLLDDSANVPIISRLALSGALRYENYGSRDFGEIVTPKLGIVWTLTPGLEARANWGRSFKAPTLLEQYQVRTVQLVRATALGATGVPATATALFRFGGNRDLEAETAEVFTAGLVARPAFAPSLRLELGYFSINYQDRVVTPISPANQALANPVFAEFVIRNPTPEQQAALIAAADRFTNASGQPTYIPANVVAIVDNASTNATRQKVSGIDAAIDYSTQFAGGTLSMRSAATWLRGRRTLTDLTPERPTAGLIYFPARFRGRASASWSDEGFTINAALNHVSGVANTNVTPNVEGDSMTTVDLILDYDAERSALGGLGINLAITNLFNARPPFLQPVLPYLVNYDSTNYSAIGRMITLSLVKRF